MARRNPVYENEYINGPRITMWLGRNIGKKKRAFSLKDAGEYVRALLRGLGMYEGMTIVPSKGVYAPDDGGDTIYEDSLVFTLLMPATRSMDFAVETAMLIALHLSAKFMQDDVYAEVIDATGTKRRMVAATCKGDDRCERIRATTELSPLRVTLAEAGLKSTARRRASAR
jgi:hypothetical protein